MVKEMNNNRIQNIDTIFDKTWKANNYNTNGMKEKVEHKKDFFNKLYNIKPKEERKKEILHANSVEGKVESLNQSMQSLNMYRQNNNKF